MYKPNNSVERSTFMLTYSRCFGSSGKTGDVTCRVSDAVPDRVILDTVVGPESYSFVYLLSVWVWCRGSHSELSVHRTGNRPLINNDVVYLIASRIRTILSLSEVPSRV